MNKPLILELYTISERYSGRVKELLLLATAELQKNELEIEKLREAYIEGVRYTINNKGEQ